MRNEKPPVPPDASASTRNFAISQSCDLPRVCRVCGGPAMPKECNNGCICRECEKRRRQKAKCRTYIRHGKYTECKVCGGMTLSKVGVCYRCRGDKQPNANNAPITEKELLERAKKYNAEHPLKAEEIKARWRAAYYG